MPLPLNICLNMLAACLTLISCVSSASSMAHASCHIHSLSEGQSQAHNYRIACPKQSYVLRQLDLNREQDLIEREFTNTELLSTLPIAPTLGYSNRTQGIMRLNYVEHQPIYLKSQHNRLPRKIARTLYQLHNGPQLPYKSDVAHEINQLMVKLYPKLKGLPHSVLKAHRRLQSLYEPLMQAQKECPCHNDLHPFNILHNKSKLWLIDWETAAMGNPLFDLATVANFFQFSPLDEHVLLHSYFQKMPKESIHAQFYLMKQVSLVYFSLRYLDYAWHGKHSKDGLLHASFLDKQLTNLPAKYFESINPPLVAFQNKLDSSAKLQRYALALLQKLCSNMTSSRFDRAVVSFTQNTHGKISATV